MVFDVDKLKEAVELWDGPDARLEGVYIQTIDRAFDAARMVVAGQPLWWCEEHKQSGTTIGSGWEEAMCEFGYRSSQQDECRMVERWLS